MRPARFLLTLTTALVLASVAAHPAQAQRQIQSEAAVATTYCRHCPPPEPFPKKLVPPPEGEIEGACGLALDQQGRIYLADYYHRMVDVYSSSGTYERQISEPGFNSSSEINSLDSVCALAVDPEGNLYGAEWHGDLLRLSSPQADLERGEITGIAIDPDSGRLFVNHRTYLEEFATPMQPGDPPLATTQLPAGAAKPDAYGLAASNGRLYVADAAKDRVLVYAAPLTSLASPLAVVNGGFTSLTDASLAVDPTNGHLLVVDDRQPGYAHPRSAVLEFGSPADGYEPLTTLPGAPIFGAPSGITATDAGDVLLTDGNDELANVFRYGPFGLTPAPLVVTEAPAQMSSLAESTADSAASLPTRVSPSTSTTSRNRNKRHRRHVGRPRQARISSAIRVGEGR